MNEKTVQTKEMVTRYFVTILIAEGLLSEEQAEKVFKRFLLADNGSTAKDSENVA